MITEAVEAMIARQFRVPSEMIVLTYLATTPAGEQYRVQIAHDDIDILLTINNQPYQLSGYAILDKENSLK